MGKSILLDQRQWLGRTVVKNKGASLQLDWTTGLDNWMEIGLDNWI
jgi:hypothetical protein